MSLVKGSLRTGKCKVPHLGTDIQRSAGSHRHNP